MFLVYKLENYLDFLEVLDKLQYFFDIQDTDLISWESEIILDKVRIKCDTEINKTFSILNSSMLYKRYNMPQAMELK